jgi:hypothetical protein
MNDENEKKEIKEIRETAVRYGIRPEAHKPVVVERDGDVVYVAMKETDFQAVEQWLTQVDSTDDTTTQTDSLKALFGDLWPEAEAYQQMLPQLLRTHKGHWVAIHDGKLLDSDVSHSALAERVLSISGSLLIEQVQETFPREFEVWSPWEYVHDTSV